MPHVRDNCVIMARLGQVHIFSPPFLLSASPPPLLLSDSPPPLLISSPPPLLISSPPTPPSLILFSSRGAGPTPPAATRRSTSSTRGRAPRQVTGFVQSSVWICCDHGLDPVLEVLHSLLLLLLLLLLPQVPPQRLLHVRPCGAGLPVGVPTLQDSADQVILLPLIVTLLTSTLS